MFRRYGISLRQAAFVGAAVVCAGLIAALSGHGSEPVTTETVAYTAPRPNMDGATAIASAATHVADDATAPKPAVAPDAATGLSSIESGINSILESAGRTEKKVVVGKGDTLMDLLVNKASVPRDEAYQAVQALSKVYNPRDINPGREITVFFHKDPAVANAHFSGLSVEKDTITAVTVKKDGDAYKAGSAEKAVHRALNAFSGKIDSSLYADAAAAGVPDAVILDLIKMYSWNVDFQRDIHNGDKFEVMYEEYKTDDGKVVPGRGNIAYAKLTLGGEEMPFYRYTDARGDSDYYDAQGRSAKKPLMKTPVDGARISSKFGVRVHPVLGYTKMHKGIDFAVARGTPIYAAGDGTIVKIGPFSSYGNYVRIRHRNGLDTAYGHMNGFKSGLRSGSRVKQGQVIGYVGMTGRATGPHLHYEILVNNAQVNPATVKVPTGRALKGRDLHAFKSQVAQMQDRFDSIGHFAVASNPRKSDKLAQK